MCSPQRLRHLHRLRHGRDQSIPPRNQGRDRHPVRLGIFTSALRQVVDHDGRVHQGKVRPLIRGRIEPKRIGQMYRRAKNEGLLIDTGDREPSNDAVGRNTDKLDRIYLLRGAA